MGIFLPIANILYLALGSLCLEKLENECLVLKLLNAVNDE